MHEGERIRMGAQERLKAVLVRRQPITVLTTIDDDVLYSMPPKTVDKLLRLSEGRKPHHTPSAVVVNHIGLSGHDHRGDWRVTTKP